MTDTLRYILNKYDVHPTEGARSKSIEIPGRREVLLPNLFKELNFKVGAEIGVERALYSKILCETIQGLTLYGVDPWMAYRGYREHVSQSKLNNFYEEVIKRMKPYDFRIFRAFSEEAYKYFDNNSLDFVYIDGNHNFLNATQDIAFWSPKVKVGGIVSGHDYRRDPKKNFNDVKDVVPAYAYAMKINPWFILKEPKGASSWFWVKEED